MQHSQVSQEACNRQCIPKLSRRLSWQRDRQAGVTDLLLPGVLGEGLTVLTGEGAGIAHEGRRQSHISWQGCQLSLQADYAHLPAGPLSSQAYISKRMIRTTTHIHREHETDANFDNNIINHSNYDDIQHFLLVSSAGVLPKYTSDFDEYAEIFEQIHTVSFAVHCAHVCPRTCNLSVIVCMFQGLLLGTEVAVAPPRGRDFCSLHAV